VYRKVDPDGRAPESFEFPDGGKLASDNRWVMMAQLIPWSEFETEYAQNFDQSMGAPAKSFRMALGALIIKEKLGTSDRETVEQIRENPYLQYFIGLSSYSNQLPFDASLLVHFRKRISVNLVNKVNQKMVKTIREATSTKSKSNKKEPSEPGEKPNQGKLLLDATCASADITYPTDIGILDRARMQTEKIVDILYESIKNLCPKKPRTYRKKARKDYLAIAKQRRPTQGTKRTAIKKQLQYLKRNLAHIEKLIKLGSPLDNLSKQQDKLLLVCQEVYRQQSWMYQNKTNRIDDRIVSLTQPHVRPIVRGKAGKATEFGAKLSASSCDGYIFLDRISWDNFNESGDLVAQVEAFKEFTGHYPESVHVDQIYRTLSNRAWCKEKGIRMSGPPLGRRPAQVSKATKKQAKEDEKARQAIEGKFGQAKRKFNLDRVMAKLDNTSQTVVAIAFLVMNLVAGLRKLLWLFLRQFLLLATPLAPKIIKNYVSVSSSKEKLNLLVGEQ
jgi:transposase, IS5 family